MLLRLSAANARPRVYAKVPIIRRKQVSIFSHLREKKNKPLSQRPRSSAEDFFVEFFFGLLWY